VVHAFLHACRQTDKLTDMAKQIGEFFQHLFANASKCIKIITIISPTMCVFITRIGYNAIDLQEKAVSITRVHVGYNAIEIKQINKFNIS
jgi:hypothetical protein